MSNEEHLTWLRQGVVFWNQWRKENPDVIPELSGVNLSNAILSGFNLFQANLSEANLSRADLKSANLSRSSLFKANLSRSVLSGADLFGADFFGADLREANLRGAQAQATNFQKAQLTGACIEDWKVSNQTNLDEIICEYVYFKKNRQIRIPASRCFRAGEFTSLFQGNLPKFDRSKPQKLKPTLEEANWIIQPPDLKIVKAAQAIEELLLQLSQAHPSSTYPEKVKVVVRALDYIERHPTMKETIIEPLKFKGTEALIEAVESPLVALLLPVFREWERESS
jgi:uncharacterized protein YjbI with pentapeptide repeats